MNSEGKVIRSGWENDCENGWEGVGKVIGKRLGATCKRIRTLSKGRKGKMELTYHRHRAFVW